LNAVLKYPGAKNRIANWICGYIPSHNTYLEPFFGSGGVFFNKSKAKIETINDLNSDVVNYFRVLRECPEELIKLLELTPYARNEYYDAYKESENEIEKARRFCVKCFMGFGCGNLYRNGFRSSQQSNSPKTALAWTKLPETLRLATERLKDAQIENLPAVELIKRYNTRDVFIYADPPYLSGTRKPYLYKHEMTEEQGHIELLEILIEHLGKVLISGYDNPLYNDMLKDWTKEYKSTTAERGFKRTEVIWRNYENIQLRIENFIN